MNSRLIFFILDRAGREREITWANLPNRDATQAAIPISKPRFPETKSHPGRLHATSNHTKTHKPTLPIRKERSTKAGQRRNKTIQRAMNSRRMVFARVSIIYPLRYSINQCVKFQQVGLRCHTSHAYLYKHRLSATERRRGRSYLVGTYFGNKRWPE